MACSRYSWQIVLDKHQRSNLQASLKSALAVDLESSTDTV